MFDKLFHDFDRVSRHMAAIKCPQGWRPTLHAPNTLAELKETVNDHGIIPVSRDFSEHTIYDDPAGNWAFRAWHDATHLAIDGEFDRAGELAVFREQCADMRDRWPAFIPWSEEHFAMMVNIIRCEIVGQFDYNETYGDYPQYQRKFTTDYLMGEY
ncbi:MAG TPA: hypothetical protein VIY48_05490 [Candidatus Paceibacterota bacterium]